MSSDPLKTRARNLQKALGELLNVPVKLSQAYELIAREEGFANWDTASARLKKRELATAPTTRLTPWMPIANEWHPDGFSIDRIIAKQPNVGVILDIISRNMSLTVITGLTGSGRTSFAGGMMMRQVNESIRAIDMSSQANQIGFENAIRNSFRMDPDVIFVGELRTVAHVELAVTAVKTGHRVIATLHGGKERTIHECLLSSIPGMDKSPLIEGFRDRTGFEIKLNNEKPVWNCHHIHVEYKSRADVA